jgi:predicted Rossmann-fold nucleotide-binding protein
VEAPTDDGPSPSGLYTSDDLLGGWSAEAPLSYATTRDARVFSAAVAAGLRTPRSDGTALRRALHDHAITLAVDDLIEGRRVVAFMGGFRLERGSPAYALVAEIAGELTRQGYLVVSGGGPGAMEAAQLGARLSPAPPADLEAALAMLSTVAAFPHYELEDFVDGAGHLDERLLAELHAWQAPAFAVAARWPADPAHPSLGIPTWLYGHEPPTPLAPFHAKYFANSLREDGLLAIAKAGVVFAEGSAGTLQEIFQDAAQNYYGSVDRILSPMVFLDLDGCWTVARPVRPLLEGLLGDLPVRLLHFVTTAEDAVAAIRCGPAPQETPRLVP